MVPNSVPALDNGDEQCHLQLLVVHSSLLREVCVCVSKGVLKNKPRINPTYCIAPECQCLVHCHW